MPHVEVNISPKVFNPAYLPYLRSPTRYQIFYGGSSSGKSRFVAQRTILDIMEGDRNYLLIRNTASTIRTSMFAELQQVIQAWDVAHLFTVNKSEMSITCHNGCQALSKGLDDVEKIKSILPKSGVITDIWGEETTEFKEDDLRQLERRLRGAAKVPKRFTMTFNPILRSHWIYKRFFSGVFADNDTEYRDDSLSILKTTYKDNRFLATEDRQVLENETDPYWRDVYTLGNWGVLGDIIFKNWSVADNVEQDHFDNYRNGIDFGYGADPFAFNRSHYDAMRGVIYITHELHEAKQTNQMIAERVGPIIGKEVVTCDSAEPKSVQELVAAGINAQGAVKGKDSINFGVQWLQQQEIVIDRQCQHTINEFELYQWQKNKDGESLPVPVKRNDHHIDAIRYSYERDMLSRSIFTMGMLQQCQM